MHGWFVCPTVPMVTTSKAGGLEKTLLVKTNRLLTHKTVKGSVGLAA